LLAGLRYGPLDRVFHGKFKECTKVALTIIKNVTSVDYKYFVKFKNTFEEYEGNTAEERQERIDKLAPMQLARHVVKKINPINSEMYLENFELACYIVRNLGPNTKYEEYMQYLNPEELLHDDDAMLQKNALEMYNEWLTETEGAEQQKLVERDLALQAEMDDDEDDDDEGEGATYQTWQEYLLSLDNENDFINPDFDLDPININPSGEVHAREMRELLSKPVYDSGKVRKQSSLLFFKEDFDPKLYLSTMHARAMDKSLEDGVNFLKTQVGVNEQKKKAAFAEQFHRFVRCKYVLDGFGGEGPFLETIAEVTDPMDLLKNTFSDAYDSNLSTMRPIHERQEQIEQQKQRLRTMRKFKGEFAQASRVTKAISNFPGDIYVVVNEWKLVKARRSESSVRKSSMLADVQEFIGTLFEDARNKILSMLLSNEHNRSLDKVELFITALLELGYKKDCVKQYLDAARRQFDASLDYCLTEFEESCRELTWREDKALAAMAGSKSVVATFEDMDDHSEGRAGEYWRDESRILLDFIIKMTQNLETRIVVYWRVAEKYSRLPCPYILVDDTDNHQGGYDAASPNLRSQGAGAYEKHRLRKYEKQVHFLISRFCTLIPAAISRVRRQPSRARKEFQEQVRENAFRVAQLGAHLAKAFTGLQLPKDVQMMLESLHANMVFLFAEKRFSVMQDSLRQAHASETWEIDPAHPECTTLVYSFFEFIETLLNGLSSFVVDQGVADVDLIAAIGRSTLTCVAIFFDNLHHIVSDPQAPANMLATAPNEEKRVLLLLANLRYFRDIFIVHSSRDNPNPRLVVLFQSCFGAEFPEEHVTSLVEWADTLEHVLLRRYVLLKTQPLRATIMSSFACVGFHWTKNFHDTQTEAPFSVRPEVMEVLLEVVAVHSELNSSFGINAAGAIIAKEPNGPVRRGMPLIVDAVVIAFIQASRIPDQYSQDGAWQLLVDLSFVEWVLEIYMSPLSRSTLRDVVQTANQISSATGGKSRRDEVSRANETILSKTKNATEGIWAGIRAPNSSH